MDTLAAFLFTLGLLNVTHSESVTSPTPVLKLHAPSAAILRVAEPLESRRLYHRQRRYEMTNAWLRDLRRHPEATDPRRAPVTVVADNR